MSEIIPESGKPADLYLSDIQTATDCDRALIWLNSVLLDMERQVNDRGLDDKDWLKKVRAAERATTNLRHRILEKRDNLESKSTLHEAISIVTIGSLPEAALEVLAKALADRFPHLAGFDLTSLKDA